MKTLIHFIFCTLIIQYSLAQSKKVEKIDIWYGDEQSFGLNGRAQNWINILGNVDRNTEWESVTYMLNGKNGNTLTLGSDKHRLANKGDFNIELSWEEVNEGENKLEIIATPKKGKTIRREVSVNVTKGKKWPLPYYLDFSKTKNLQEVVQVVDGRWELTPEGVKTAEPYYDRVLTIGDTNWTNYEANIELTIHDFTPSEKGPPTYDVTHFGVALRWRGHVPNGLQPSRQWYPLGSQGEFFLKDDLQTCTWRILYNGGKDAPKPTYSTKKNAIQLNEKIKIRAQVSTLPNGDTQYRFKQWKLHDPEPFKWDVEGIENGSDDFPSGALCLVPHNSNVTIHQLVVQPLVKNEVKYAALPGPGMLHYSAPMGNAQGAKGEHFFKQVLPPNSKLTGIQVNAGALGNDSFTVIRGIKFFVEKDGVLEEILIGLSEGNWQEKFELHQEAELVGINGASGWWLDKIQFVFSNGSTTPLYGGKGGDTTFNLKLNQQKGEYGGRIRGFHGIYNDLGITTIGLIFDPAD